MPECFAVFSSSFVVLCLVCKSLHHFEFDFVYGVRVCSNFINLHVAVHLRESVLGLQRRGREMTKDGHKEIEN